MLFCHISLSINTNQDLSNTPSSTFSHELLNRSLFLVKMVKSKFPGKPSKIIQRSLVRAYSVAVPSCDSSTVSEEVFLGLSVFDQTFGAQDEVQFSPFLTIFVV